MNLNATAESNEQDAELKTGYVKDYVSGYPVKIGAEEVQAVQVFARRLVEDFGYSKTHITTRPQYRVRRRPSDAKRSYPVDIAVFSADRKHDDDLIMIVECKAESEKEGRRQLELYLSMSTAQIGVWFNGKSHLYLRKRYVEGGLIAYEPLPTLPRYGQRVDEIGLYRRKDLKSTEQLKSVLRDIRNHLAGNVTGITRDEALAQQIINILFCKVFDEISRGPEEMVEFRAAVNERKQDISRRIRNLFTAVKDRYDDVFDPSDSIDLDDNSIEYVVGELQPFLITEAKRDVVGDAFEVFMGPALRGEEGQFFTPRNVVHMIIDIINPEPDEAIIDPACGTGGFLIAALDRVWTKIERDGKRRGLSKDRIREEQWHVASRYFRGIDKDRFLTKVAKAYMAILGDGKSGIFCENSLLPPARWNPITQTNIRLGTFDIVVTNPPFGTKIPIKGGDVLKQYTLAHRAKKDKASGSYEWTSKLYDKQRHKSYSLSDACSY